MISLKKLMSETGQIPAAETWHRALSLLVQGIALHAVVFDEAQHDKFREELDQLSTAISPQSPPDGVMRTVGALKSPEAIARKLSAFENAAVRSN